MTDLSICIISYNARQYLRDCLLSIQADATRRSVEIIVTDNGSTDGSVEMLQAEFPQVQVIRNPGNLGYTVPMNQALRRGQGRSLMQLNPDTLVQLGMLDTLLDYMEAHPQVGILTPKVLNRDGTLQYQCRRSAARPWDAFAYMLHLDRLFPGDKRFGGYLMTYMDENTTHPAEAVSGSCMLIRREVVEQVGYLDEAIFAYQEDTEFCFRARQAGWQIIYLPTARIIHYGGQGGSKNQPYRGVIAWHRSYIYYYRKHLAKDYFFLFNWFFYLLIYLKLGISLAATFLRKDKHVGTPKP